VPVRETAEFVHGEPAGREEGRPPRASPTSLRGKTRTSEDRVGAPRNASVRFCRRSARQANQVGALRRAPSPAAGEWYRREPAGTFLFLNPEAAAGNESFSSPTIRFARGQAHKNRLLEQRDRETRPEERSHGTIAASGRRKSPAVAGCGKELIPTQPALLDTTTGLAAVCVLPTPPACLFP
jgi:hypothetical protein